MARTHNRIVLKSKGHYGEGVADGAITPGMAITQAADGEWDACVPAQAAALKAGLILAIEAPLEGSTIVTAYAADDIVFWYAPVPGDEVNVLVKDGETIAVGDFLVVEGTTSGLFVEAAGSETKFQLKALEALSPSGANGYVACRVESP